MMAKLSYYLFFGFWWLVTLIPLKVLYGFSDFIFIIIYHLLSYRRKVTLENLANSFPEKSSSEIQLIARRFYRRLADQIIESFKLIHMSKKQMQRRFIYTNPELLEGLYQAGKSVILVAGHHSTWQWIISLPLVTKHKILAVYKPTSFKELPNIYNYVSKKYGTVTVPMNEIYRAIIDSKLKNELSLSFILGDQRPFPETGKHWTNFLNQDTPAITGFERIAKKTDQAVVFLDIQWKKRGYYEVTFRKICDNPGEFKDYDLTDAYFKVLEEIIIDRPEFWLWTHKRWKHKREKL